MNRLQPVDSHLVETAKGLPLAQRIELIEALWESVAAEGYDPALTPEQAREIDRRVEAHRRHPDDVVSWNSIKEELSTKYQKR